MAIGYQFPFTRRKGLEVIGFSDALTFSGGNVDLPLEIFFSSDVPIAFPAMARFGDLQGSARHYGLGLFLDQPMRVPLLGDVHSAYGFLWEVLELRHYLAQYTVTSGASEGTTGISDYSETYRFVTPMIQFARHRKYRNWLITPKITAALPLPRVVVQGRISGPDFNIAGNTDDNGKGKHYGDVSLTFGLLVEYRPWHLSFDPGSLLSQALLEPLIHKGIEKNWVFSLKWKI